MKIRYTPKALAQLDAIYSFIESHNPRAAKAVEARIQRAIGRLARFLTVVGRPTRRAFAFCRSFAIPISCSMPSTKQRRRCKFSACATPRKILSAIWTKISTALRVIVKPIEARRSGAE